MNPGDILPNGATVITASARKANEWVILALYPLSARDPFVTWKASRPGTGVDTHTGHYFNNIEMAVADFYARP